MLDNITPVESLLAEAADIQAYAEVTPGDNINEIAGRVADLGAFIARTGKMLADARYHLNARRKEETIELVRKTLSVNQLSAKVQNSLVDSVCRDEQYLVDWIERLNRALTHQQEAARSLLSYEKENLRIAKTGY
jgi:hypothetical protein